MGLGMSSLIRFTVGSKKPVSGGNVSMESSTEPETTSGSSTEPESSTDGGSTDFEMSSNGSTEPEWAGDGSTEVEMEDDGSTVAEMSDVVATVVGKPDVAAMVAESYNVRANRSSRKSNGKGKSQELNIALKISKLGHYYYWILADVHVTATYRGNTVNVPSFRLELFPNENHREFLSLIVYCKDFKSKFLVCNAGVVDMRQKLAHFKSTINRRGNTAVYFRRFIKYSVLENAPGRYFSNGALTVYFQARLLQPFQGNFAMQPIYEDEGFIQASGSLDRHSVA